MSQGNSPPLFNPGDYSKSDLVWLRTMGATKIQALKGCGWTIIVIAAMVAMFIPCLNASHQAAKNANSLHMLKQLWEANKLYSEGNNGYLPGVLLVPSVTPSKNEISNDMVAQYSRCLEIHELSYNLLSVPHDVRDFDNEEEEGESSFQHAELSQYFQSVQPDGWEMWRLDAMPAETVFMHTRLVKHNGKTSSIMAWQDRSILVTAGGKAKSVPNDKLPASAFDTALVLD